MIRLLDALRSEATVRGEHDDAGISIIEVVVAMLVFGLVAAGILAGTNAVIGMTADNLSRQVAVNLVEQQLDADRGKVDPFKVFAGTTTAKVGNRTYTVKQTTSFLNAAGTPVSCGSNSNYYYRQVTVTVTWTGMLATTKPVESDTVIAPNGRINDASTGTIAVQVTGSTGTPLAGIAVSITPDPSSTTATALQSQPNATDVEGCSYATGVTPGTYTVALSNSGYVYSNSSATVAPNSGNTVSVSAGSTTSASFSYDRSASLSLTYGSSTSPKLPTNMAVTFLSTTNYVTSSSQAAPSTVSLYPYPAGYQGVAGNESNANGTTRCAAEDPANWPAGSYGGKTLAAGQRGQLVAPSAGGSAALGIPMGLVSVTNARGYWITAVGQNSTANGQPGCANTEQFAFDQLSSNSAQTLALPYGTYTIYVSKVGAGQRSSLLGSTGSLTMSPVNDPVNGALTGFTASTSVLTLDPRAGS